MQKFTVVFLLDKPKPTKVVLLKRSLNKDFAPGKYTGIGGKQEEGETIDETAYRELKEETGIENIVLKEFARAKIINTQQSIHYYQSVFKEAVLPYCNEGTLEWVSKNELLNKDIIHTTKFIIKEWMARGFAANRPWTFIMHRKETNSVKIDVEVDDVLEGLNN